MIRQDDVRKSLDVLEPPGILGEYFTPPLNPRAAVGCMGVPLGSVKGE